MRERERERGEREGEREIAKTALGVKSMVQRWMLVHTLESALI